MTLFAESGTPRVLSGVRPTGKLHLGNYFGAVKQFTDLQDAGKECYYFVADLHALTEVQGPTDIDRLSLEVAKNYLACGIDPTKSVLYRQSDVPEISEIAVLLGNTMSIAKLRRCTTYKGKRDAAAVAELMKHNVSEDDAKRMVADEESSSVLSYAELRQVDNQFSYGMLGYPVLMAADILAVNSTLVPVGADQKQHVEMARDFARSFNHMFNQDVFIIPEITDASTLTVRGIDGADKMGKSEGNTIALLEDLKTVEEKIKRIPTQSEPGGDMTPGTQSLFNLVELCCPGDVHTDFLRRYHRKQGKFFGEMKECLVDGVRTLLIPIQERYAALSDDDVRQHLYEGKEQASAVANLVLHKMQFAMGLQSRIKGIPK